MARTYFWPRLVVFGCIVVAVAVLIAVVEA
jgi:hypothetical protein